MKVAMERGKLTLISLRAPFLGEVARIEVDEQNLLIVNKFKKRYYRKSMADLGRMAPDFQSDLQAMLLGRIFILGDGQLERADAAKLDIFPMGADQGYMLVPGLPDDIESVVYGFLVSPQYMLSRMVVAYGRQQTTTELTATEEVASNGTAIEERAAEESSFEPLAQLQADFAYPEKGGARINLEGSYGSRTYTATVTADKVQWGAKMFDRIDVAGYQNVSFREVIKLK